MAPKKLSFSIVWAIVPIIVAQSLSSITSCVNENASTAFPNCNSLFSSLDYCNGPSVSSGAPYVSCMCNQVLFNSYYGCESDYRICFGTNAEDLTIEDGLEVWHSICDPELTTSLTTPPVSSILTSFNQDYCNTANQACDSGMLVASGCSESYLSPGSQLAFTSCLCQPKLLSLEYTCEVLGNTSCLLTPGAVTNMEQYRICTNIFSVLGSPASTYANTTSSTTPFSTSGINLSTTATAIPSSHVSATTVVQTTLQGAPPAAPTASSTTKSSLGMKVSLELSSLVGPALLVTLILHI